MENNILISGNSKELIKDVLFQDICEISSETGQKVVGVTATSKVVGCEAMENEIRFNVKTTFRFIKCDQDGAYSVENAETESLRTITRDGITPAAKICLKAHVTDCELKASNKASATVEICGWFIKINEIAFLNTENEGLHCKTEQTTVENVLPLADNTLELTFTDEARMPIAKILDYSGSATVDSVYSSSGTYRVEGDINLRIVAITDNGQFITQTFSHPFTSENAEECVNADMRLESEARISNLMFSVTESDKRIVVSDITVKLCGVALETKEITKAVDVYSTKHEIAVKEEIRAFNNHFCLRTVREKASAMLSVNGGITEVLCVLTPCVSANASLGTDGLTAEGVIGATVLYSDENGTVTSVTAEMPFITNPGGDYACETVFNPEVAVTAVNARPRGGNGIEVTAELLITVRGVQSKEMRVISDVEIGEAKEENDFAISLYIVRPGETLWEVAKALNTDEEILSEQNPELKLPLKGGEKILLYKYLD